MSYVKFKIVFQRKNAFSIICVHEGKKCRLIKDNKSFYWVDCDRCFFVKESPFPEKRNFASIRECMSYISQYVDSKKFKYKKPLHNYMNYVFLIKSKHCTKLFPIEPRKYPYPT